jgi:hypothetical protein
MTFSAFPFLFLALVSVTGVFSSSEMAYIPIAQELTIESSKIKQFQANFLVVLTSWLKVQGPKYHTTVVKRGEGCTSLNGATTFSAGGAVFDIFCGMTWAYYDSLFVSYTLDFQTCMENCVRWK